MAVTKGFTLRASTTASTKRSPAPDVNNKIGAPTENIASLSCFPLMPTEPELMERLGLNSQKVHWTTYTEDGLDILAGDYLVIGSAEYPIRSVAPWDWTPDDAATTQIIVEDIKTE